MLTLRCHEASPGDCIPAAPLEGLTNAQRPSVEVDVLPSEAERFAEAQAEGCRHRHERAEAMPLSGRQERARLLWRKRLNLLSSMLRRLCERRDVLHDEPRLARPVQRDAQHRTRVSDRASCGAGFLMSMKPRLDLANCKPRDRELPEPRRQMKPDGLLVRQPRTRPQARPLVLEPGLKKLRDGLPLVRKRGALLDVAQHLGQLLAGLAARAAVDALVLPLAVLPAEIDSRHPAPVRPLRDAAFAAPSTFSYTSTP